MGKHKFQWLKIACFHGQKYVVLWPFMGKEQHFHGQSTFHAQAELRVISPHVHASHALLGQ